MKKILVLAISLIICGVFMVEGNAGSKVGCYGKCNKIKRSCENKAKNTKYDAKDGLKKALAKCDADQDECNKQCK